MLKRKDFLKKTLNPSLYQAFLPTPDTKGGGGGGGVGRTLSAFSKTLPLMNLKFCRVLATSFNVLEMLKLFT